MNNQMAVKGFLFINLPGRCLHGFFHHICRHGRNNHHILRCVHWLPSTRLLWRKIGYQHNHTLPWYYWVWHGNLGCSVLLSHITLLYMLCRSPWTPGTLNLNLNFELLFNFNYKTNIWTNIWMNERTNERMNEWMNACMYACMHACMHTCIHAYMHAWMNEPNERPNARTNE